MKYWDTSAIVPLLVTQPASATADRLISEDPALAVWWGTSVECHSAVARLERQGELDPAQTAAALDRLVALEDAWLEVGPAEVVRRTAVRLLRTHPLRSADALQLAAAIAAADGSPRDLPFVTLDGRLALAASKEGFPVVAPA